MSKKNIIGDIVIVLALIFAVSVCVICFKYQLLTTGIIIAVSFLVMLSCLSLLKIQQVKVEIEKEMMQRGPKLKQFKCNCESYHDDNSVDEYHNGELVFYENGFTYEYSNKEEVEYIDYADITDVEVSASAITMQIASSSDIINLVLTSDNVLRIRTISKCLYEQAVNLDTSLLDALN